MRTFQFSASLLRFAAVALTALALHSGAQAQVDPPGRVARLSHATGYLSFSAAGTDQWTEVSMNRPISVGDSLWVPERGKAELHIGADVIRLSERSSLTFMTLSDDTLQLKLTRGTMVVRLRSLSGKEMVEINTPNLAFSLQEAGEYRISVNDDNTTEVIVRRGTGIAYGDRDSITIREAEQVVFSGTNLNHYSIGRMPPYDNFDQWVNERDRQEDSSISARYVSRDVIGYQQLDAYGTWETHAEYGAIWLPRTRDRHWAPYRDGNWLWVAPWGWTWVDRAPWGFAPYHYGRWAHIGRRWAWVPGQHLRHERPVYAPALVAFVGGSNGINVNVNIGLGHRSGPGVAWFPLAPGEAYRPGYYASPHYLNNMNRRWDGRKSIVNHSINPSILNNPTTAYANQHVTNAVTVVPANVFSKGQFVGGAARALTRDQIANNQVGAGAPTIAPSSDSLHGTSRRISNPDHGDNQYRQRPVVATFKPAEIPAVREKLIPTPRGNDRRDGRAAEAWPDGKYSQIDPRSPIKAATSGASNAQATTPSSTISAPVLLHNNGRQNERDRNDRERNERYGERSNDVPTVTDRRGNAEPAARRPQEGPAAPVMRVNPEPAVSAPVEPSRRSAVRNAERYDRSEDADYRQSNNQRAVPGNSGAGRIEQRREVPVSSGFSPSQESRQVISQPIQPQVAPPQRTMERVMPSQREVARPVIQEPAMQAPRIERQPISEPRREPPASVAKPEREKEKDKDKSDSRNNVRER